MENVPPKETYFGFKVHVLTTLEGYITAFEITPASVDDREDLRDLAENRLGLVVFRDKGYAKETLLKIYAKKTYALCH